MAHVARTSKSGEIIDKNMGRFFGPLVALGGPLETCSGS